LAISSVPHLSCGSCCTLSPLHLSLCGLFGSPGRCVHSSHILPVFFFVDAVGRMPLFPFTCCTPPSFLLPLSLLLHSADPSLHPLRRTVSLLHGRNGLLHFSRGRYALDHAASSRGSRVLAFMDGGLCAPLSPLPGSSCAAHAHRTACSRATSHLCTPVLFS